MNVALISILDFESFPIRQLHAFMEKNEFDVSSIFLKSTGYAFPTDHEVQLMVEQLKSMNPSLIGISVRTRYYRLVCKLTEVIKKNMSVPVVWGGIHPTISPEKCIEHADIICLGEGEYAMKELAEKIDKKEDYSKIKNLWVKKDGAIIKNELRPLIDELDSLPFTDFTDNNKIYIDNGQIYNNLDDIKTSRIEFKFCYPIMTSRGCLFNCTYCANSFLRRLYLGKGKYTRRRSVGNVIEELKFAKKNLKFLNSVTFGDDVFSFDKEWLKDFAAEYKKHIDLPFFTMFNPSMVDAESVKLLKSLGLVNVQLGIQSGSEHIRKDYYHRFNTNDQIRKAAIIFKMNKLKLSCDLILGNVFESEQDRIDTLDLLLSMPKPFALHCFCMNYFPKYQFTDMAMDKGLITESDLMDAMPYDKQSFGKQFDENRPKEMLFWESVYKLATFKYFPAYIVRKLSKSESLRKQPNSLISFTKSLIFVRHMHKSAEYITRNLSSPKIIYSKIKQKVLRKQVLS